LLQEDTALCHAPHSPLLLLLLPPLPPLPPPLLLLTHMHAGFLEPQAGGAAGIAVAAAQQQAGADKGLARSSQQSSLTAALTTIGEAS
jgi:hypothetical protein